MWLAFLCSRSGSLRYLPVLFCHQSFKLGVVLEIIVFLIICDAGRALLLLFLMNVSELDLIATVSNPLQNGLRKAYR
jgi:hypothetical protein